MSMNADESDIEIDLCEAYHNTTDLQATNSNSDPDDIILAESHVIAPDNLEIDTAQPLKSRRMRQRGSDQQFKFEGGPIPIAVVGSEAGCWTADWLLMRESIPESTLQAADYVATP